MNSKIERLYQDIGAEASLCLGGAPSKFLIYAEVEDGVISADVFYVSESIANIQFEFCPRSVRKLILNLWLEWNGLPETSEWRTLSYLVDKGEFSIDLKYSDQVNKDEDISDRRALVVKKYFGDAKVDY